MSRKLFIIAFIDEEGYECSTLQPAYTPEEAEEIFEIENEYCTNVRVVGRYNSNLDR